MNKTRRGFLAALALLPGLGFLRYKRQSVSYCSDPDCRPSKSSLQSTAVFKFELGQRVRYIGPLETYIGRIVARTEFLPDEEDEVADRLFRLQYWVQQIEPKPECEYDDIDDQMLESHLEAVSVVLPTIDGKPPWVKKLT